MLKEKEMYYKNFNNINEIKMIISFYLSNGKSRIVMQQPSVQYEQGACHSMVKKWRYNTLKTLIVGNPRAIN